MLTCKASRAQSALLHRKVTRVIFSLGGEMGSLWFSPSLPNESSDLVCRGCQCTAVQWPDLHLNEIKWLNIQEWNIVMIVAIKPQPPCSGERHSTWNCCHLGRYGAFLQVIYELCVPAHYERPPYQIGNAHISHSWNDFWHAQNFLTRTSAQTSTFTCKCNEGNE